MVDNRRFLNGGILTHCLFHRPKLPNSDAIFTSGLAINVSEPYNSIEYISTSEALLERAGAEAAKSILSLVVVFTLVNFVHVPRMMFN